MATDKIFDLEVFNVDNTGKCTAEGGFVGGFFYSEVANDNVGDTIDISIPFHLADDAVTLPDGEFVGQAIRISPNRTGSTTVTGDFYGANNTLTFVGPLSGGCELVWVATSGSTESDPAWVVIGCVDGTAITLTTV